MPISKHTQLNNQNMTERIQKAADKSQKNKTNKNIYDMVSRLGWPSRQLLCARKYIVSYRI